jgi:hypothetical protein
MEPVEELEDRELIREFVALWKATRPRPTQSVAGALVGVGQSTASEWWRKVYRDIEPSTRVGLERAVKHGREAGSLNGLVPISMDGKGTNGAGDLSRQVDAILTSDADDLTKTARMIDLWGIYRQKAISDVAELLRGDREVLKLRAEAVRDLARTTRLETEQAARREDRLSEDRKAAQADKRAVAAEARARRARPGSEGETTTGTEGPGDQPPTAGPT